MDSAWTAVATADELDDGQMKALQLDGRRLLLVKTAGRHYLIDEMCSHEDYSLALGCITGTRIKCSLHGSWFDLDSGAPLDEPADTPIRSYPVKIEEGRIWARLE